MKRIYRFVCAAFAIAAAAGCEKEQKVTDFPIQGELNISGKYVTYLHGSQGWIAEDKIGVFVTSDGVEQCNLQYVPSEYCPASPNQYVEGYYEYKKEDYKDGDILLKAAGNSAGFKQGEHCIYAYVPYSEDNADHTAIKLPRLDRQEAFTFDGIRYFQPEYNFAYAVLAEPVSEYTSATLSLGEFKSAFVQMTVPSPVFPESFVGQTVTKVVISAETDIATTEATINLENGEISGAMSQSVELTFGDGVKLESGYFGVTMETLYIVMCIDFDKALETEFTFVYTINGQEYTLKGKPSSMSQDLNINMYGSLTFPEE